MGLLCRIKNFFIIWCQVGPFQVLSTIKIMRGLIRGRFVEPYDPSLALLFAATSQSSACNLLAATSSCCLTVIIEPNDIEWEKSFAAQGPAAFCVLVHDGMYSPKLVSDVNQRKCASWCGRKPQTFLYRGQGIMSGILFGRNRNKKEKEGEIAGVFTMPKRKYSGMKWSVLVSLWISQARLLELKLASPLTWPSISLFIFRIFPASLC